MFCRNFLLRVLLILILAVGQANCSPPAQNRKIKFDKIFTLKFGETAETEDAGLRIKFKRVRQTISENGETEYVELHVWSNKSERTLVISERNNLTKTIGNYLVKPVNAESFGKARCHLRISRKS